MNMPRNRFRVAAFEAKALVWWNARRSKIDMDPPYQRKGRLWSKTDKAFLIDSIINGFDVPKFYIADFTYADSQLNRRKLPYAIIDGKQRFEAIFDFFDNKVTLSPDFTYLESPNLKLGGLGYRDLKQRYPEIAEIFDNFNLAVMSVITESPDLINELFVRLNRSKPLTGAEIRNAMAGPAPEVIRKTANHEFFSEFVSFPKKRGQDLNAAAKILLFEFNGKPQETKKGSLDSFVRAAKKSGDQLELATRRTHSMLDVLTGVFLPKDPLLGSAGVVPVYYWFMRELKQSEYSMAREFLVHFEYMRRENRKKITSGGARAIDRELTDFDRYNRNTNDLTSHVERLAILKQRFKAFK